MMNPRLKTWLLPLVAVIGLLLIIAWMAGSFRDKIEPGFHQALKEPPPDSDLFVVQATEVMVTEPVPATIEAKQATTISSRIMAR